MRKGIAFFSTVMILAVVSLLVTLSMDSLFFVQKSERDKRFLIQENIFLYDVNNFLKKIIVEPLTKLKRIESKEEYLRTIFLLPISMQIPDFDGSFQISLKNEEGIPNINQITDVRFKENFFLEYLRTLKVVDPSLFANVFTANISTSILEDFGDYVLDEKDGRAFRGEITNYKDFYLILSKYAKVADDEKVMNMEWEKLIRLDGENGLNMNYIDRAVAESLPVNFAEYEIKDIIKHEEIYTNIESMGVEDEDDIADMQKVSPYFNTRFLTVELKVELPYRSVLYKFLYNVYNGSITELKIYR